MNDLNVIHLTSDGTINYLNPNVMEIFSNLNLISATGELVKMNPLTLAAMNSDLTKFLKINQVEEEQDVNTIDQFNTIITEFSTEDLKQLVQFCHQGILPKPLEILEKSEEIPPIFTAFDIDLKKLLFSQENTTSTNSKYSKNTAKIKKEKEIQNLIKNEILEDFILDDIVQTLMETETKVGKKRGRKKKNSKNNSQIDHDDLTENDYFDHLMEENDQEVSDHENDQPTAEEEIVNKPKTRRGRKKKYVSNSVIILDFILIFYFFS